MSIRIRHVPVIPCWYAYAMVHIFKMSEEYISNIHLRTGENITVKVALTNDAEQTTKLWNDKIIS